VRRRPTTIVALAVAALAAFAGAPRAQQDWIEYRPPGEGFRVEFPGRPTVTRDDAAGTRYGRASTATATVELPSGVAFYATYIAYPPGTASREPDKVLDTQRLGRTAIGKLRNERRFSFKGHPAQRETVDWQGPRPTVIIALDVLRGDRLYSVYCFVPPGQESHPGLQHFLDSFDLLPP
jgi:hypothetical protein